MIQPLVLAAGLGTRMGASKPLLPIDGHPALNVVLRTIERAGLRLPVVVLGHDVDRIQELINLSECQVVVNENPELGLSSSMRLGLDAINEDAEGILVFHVDMPFLALSTIRSLLQAVADGATLAAPFHEGTRGFPVYLSRMFITPLCAVLEGDRGAQRFLVDHDDDLTPIIVSDPGCVFDIDLPADLQAWKGESLCAINE
ncbi:NTP transferase domain-containing protein [Candidatus Bipolaricaulota bacterium]